MTYNKESEAFLRDFASKYTSSDIVNHLENLKNLKVLIIGDGIIDEYHYCIPMGKSAKSPIVVHKYLSHEVFAGGVFIIANHIANICDNVHLITVLGDEDSKEDFIENKLNWKIDTKFFYRKDSPTIRKKRYIEQSRNTKLFEVNYLNNSYITPELEDEIIDYLKIIIDDYDVVLVSDFGHGFITSKIIQTIHKCSKIYCVNAQTNGANAGFNMITKYNSPNFVCLDETEARLAIQDRFSDIPIVINDLSQKIESDCLMITLGKYGSVGLKDNKIIFNPIFSTDVLDTVGAGDAFFAFSAPCYAIELPLDLISFIGNCAGALAVKIMGNKRPIEKDELIKFMSTILQ